MLLTATGLMLAGCGSASRTTASGSVTADSGVGSDGSNSAPSSGPDDPWATESIDTLKVGDPPPFPEPLTHWRLIASWSDLPRAFVQADQQWTATVGPNATPFPATMNGCDDGRFLVRWRAVDDVVNVIAGAGTTDGQMNVDGPVDKQVTGHSGWMDLDGCSAPVFRMGAALTNGQNLEDVTVEVQQYQPAP